MKYSRRGIVGRRKWEDIDEQTFIDDIFILTGLHLPGTPSVDFELKILGFTFKGEQDE